MMAGYIRSKGQVLNRSQIRESLQRQRINPTDHQRRRVRVRNPIPYNAAYYGHKLHCDQNSRILLSENTLATSGKLSFTVSLIIR